MIPRDWMLERLARSDEAKAGQPGASAPSRAEVEELVRVYG